MTSKETLEELQCVLASNQVTKRYSDILKKTYYDLLKKIQKYQRYKKEKSVDISLIKDIMLDKIKEWLENE